MPTAAAAPPAVARLIDRPGLRRWCAAGVATSVLAALAIALASVPIGAAARLGGVAAGVLAALLFAALGWHAADRAARRVEAHERRLAALLDIAADHYWELDAELRLTHLGGPYPQQVKAAIAPVLGKHPWEFDNAFGDATQRDAHVAELKARRPFDGLRQSRRDAQGRVHHRSVSGRPRFADDGRFLGYWGVDRDISAEVEAREAIAASEARYRELFERSPSPLLLHRHGRVVDANPAAAALFDFSHPADMKGVEIAMLHADADSRERTRARLRALDDMAVGEALPVADFRMKAITGRPIAVQASAVRVATGDGPAALSFYVDITARAATETALRSSQALLSTLFASSPDGIVLTVIASGRYVTVNERFAQMLGYRVDEVIGRTSIELGIWADPATRTELVDALAARGHVREMPAMLRGKAGQRIAVSISATHIDMDGQPHLVATLRDVTDAERLRLEHAAVFRSAIVGIALTRSNRFQLANPRFHEIFRHPPGALVGQPGAVVWPDPAAYEEAGSVAAPLLSLGRPVRIERPMRRGDGSVFWCRLQAQVVDPGNPVDGGTVWIVEDITERRQLDANLAAARDAADAANRAKSVFLANTSHEIRTPLNGLLGLARLAAQDTVDPGLRHQYLAQLVDSAHSLAGIISDILDLSKIEAGKLSVEALPFSLRHTLASVHRSYLPLAEACGLALSIEIAAAVPETVRGDPQRVRQILANFVTNALKFTPQGRVTIGARSLGGNRLRLAVSDTGPGIDAALRSRLFTPFTQGDASITRRFGGSGLGLSICHELALLMGGAVGVDSVPGNGSEFWAELPLPAVDAPAAAPAPSPSGPDASNALAGLRVLVVEDNAVNMMIVLAMLEQWGALGSEAGDGVDAIAAVDAAARDGRPFDVVLMDVQMPRMGGHEAARRLRQRFDASTLPIVALTAAALVAERDEAFAAGMNDFLTKPIDAARLFETLLRYAGSRQTL